VAGIVDGRGHFVGKQLAAVFENSMAEHADVLRDSRTRRAGVFAARCGGVEARAGGRERRRMRLRWWFSHERVNGGFAIARADRKDGEFASEGDKALEDQF